MNILGLSRLKWGRDACCQSSSALGVLGIIDRYCEKGRLRLTFALRICFKGAGLAAANISAEDFGNIALSAKLTRDATRLAGARAVLFRVG